MSEPYDKIAHLLPSQLKRLRQTLDDKDSRPSREPPLVKRGDGDREPPLSFAQERLWFLEEMGLVGAAYNMPFALRFKGPLDAQALERSLAELVRRHASLRTRFRSREGGAVQVIDEPGAFRLERVDLGALEARTREDALRCQVNERSQARLDLRAGPLFNVTLFALGAREHVLLITTHHIVADGWSVSIMMKEISALYDAYSRGRPSPLSEPELQYADFAVWQQRWLQGEVLERQLAYWREQLHGAPAALELPTDHARPAVATFKGAKLSFDLGQETSDRLQELAQAEQATLFMVLLAAYHVLLSRLSGQQDVVVGSPIAGRTRRATEGLIGFFLNTLVLRARLAPEMSFRELLARVRETTLGAHAHQDVPFEKLVAELRPERDLSRLPLCQVGLTLQNLPREETRVSGLTITPLSADNVTAKFDLWFLMNEGPLGLRGTVEYASDLFERDTVARWTRHFRTLLTAAAADPECALARLPLLGEAEREQILVAWNAVRSPHPPDGCIHDLIAAQAARTPDALALLDPQAQVTFGELELRANRLAHELRARGVGPETPVGLYLNRSARAILALLGILKAGGVYVPLDDRLPPERLSQIMRDAGIALVLTEKAHLDSLPSHWGQTLCLDDDAARASIDSRPAHAPHSGAGGGNLAYVIYTSGSTGAPKGVAVQHDSLCASTRARMDFYGSPGRIVLLPALAFDSSVATIFWALCTGGTLVLPAPGLERDAQRLAELIEREAVHGWLGVPSLYDAVLDLGAARLPSLRTLVLAGEAVPPTLVRKHHAELEACALFNEYGPTEATVWASVARLGPETASLARTPIGRPIANARLYVLDACLEALPVGVTGELYIGGAGVARGYLNRAGITAERFIADPHGPTGARMYRSGDLVRWTADGELVFLGRADHQLKLRGYRIEPQEIEGVLLAHARVKQAVVLARAGADGDPRLVAYVAGGAGEAAVAPDELREHVGRLLPGHMVPSDIVTLDALPLTANGKVDRDNLPAPRPVEPAAFVAPRTPTEQAVAAIWSEVLKVERVGATDNFFHLGGHSLLATRVVAHIRDRMRIDFPVTLLFGAPTVAESARVIDLGRAAAADEDPCEGAGFQEEVI